MHAPQNVTEETDGSLEVVGQKLKTRKREILSTKLLV